MKTIEQLLTLSKNKYYKFTNDEKAVLDDFLSKRPDDGSKSSQKKNSKKSSGKTNVRVRNIVPKTVPSVEDAPEPSDAP